MRAELTPAAQRALQSATTWTSAHDTQQQELGVPEILMGLLAEPECRAALLLSSQGIGATAVRDRFSLVAVDAPDPGRLDRTSKEWIDCVSAAEKLLIEYPQPLTLATEHLLLGIAAADNEVSRWLAERGLPVAELEAEVHRLNGHEPGPLPIDLDDEETSPPTDEQDTGPLAEQEHVAALRAIDAAANRAGEGLRVVEDYLRFALDDRHLTAECKSIRHELAAALEPFSSFERHAARDTRGDVGTDLSLASEQSRPDTAAVAGASFKRVEQALRSLEEFSKLLAGNAARQFEQLRYRTYSLERACSITSDALERLAEVRLYVLIDAGPSIEAFGRLVEALVSAGVGAIQLRDKRLSDRALLDHARMLRDQTRGTSTLFIMNDRADLTVLSGADGVHVGQEELTVAEARRVVGPRGLIGVSTHTLDQAREAVLDGASYIGVGPTFPTETKQFAEFPGTGLLAQVASEIRLPAFAIGGITLENLPSVLETGITRVALGSAITGAIDPAGTAVAFIEALSSG